MDLGDDLAEATSRAAVELQGLLERAKKPTEDELLDNVMDYLGKTLSNCLEGERETLVVLVAPGQTVYKDLLLGLNVGTFKDLEDAWKENWSRAGGVVEEAVEQLWRSEEDWDNFLRPAVQSPV